VSKRTRIGGAILLSIGFILGAFYLKYNTVNTQTGAVVAVPQPTVPRTYIAQQNNWENGLESMTLRAAKDAPEIDIEGTEGETNANTVTDVFARSFFENYTRSSLSGALSENNKELFLKASLSDLLKNTEDVPYGREDVLIGDSSDASLRDYGNRIAEITVRYSPNNTENELSIFERALQSNSPEDYQKLTNISDAYAQVLADTLKVAAPPDLANEHLMLLNAYQAVQHDIDAMAHASADPVYALLRVKRYDSDVQTLVNTFSRIYLYLHTEGIRYADDEAGALFRAGT